MQRYTTFALAKEGEKDNLSNRLKWLPDDLLKAEVVLWYAERCRTYENYQKILGEYGSFLTTENHRERMNAVSARLYQGKKGEMAADFTYPDRNGKLVSLSDFRGKVVLVDVWATWCGPCCAEIPHLEKLVERFKDNDKIQFISISVDTALKAWLNKLEKDKPAWAQFIFPKEEAARFMQAWGISGIPRFILIDRNGKIYAADAPRPSDEGLVEILEKAMNEE